MRTHLDFPVCSCLWLTVPDDATPDYRETLWRGTPEFRDYDQKPTQNPMSEKKKTLAYRFLDRVERFYLWLWDENAANEKNAYLHQKMIWEIRRLKKGASHE